MSRGESTVLAARDLRKSFSGGVEVLLGVDLRMEAGESLAITGPSGSGKSTLLHILGTLERPSAGRIEILGHDPSTYSERELARFRNQELGFVFQHHHLLPKYSVLENVLIPTLATSTSSPGKMETWGRELLGRVGLGHRLAFRPAQLSGGEKQRAAVARALIQRPSLLLCDEPTGNLDPKTAHEVLDLLLELHREGQGALIVVTHSQEMAQRMDRHLELREGRCGEA
jgi:lipoprotein-releasing system ATP-binding protein